MPQHDRRLLRGDVAAGIAVTALIVPKNLGNAGIAGIPLVLDLEGVDFVDQQGLAKLSEFLRAGEIELRLARGKPHVLAVLDADGVVDLIGTDHIHDNVHRAVQAALDALRPQVP